MLSLMTTMMIKQQKKLEGNNYVAVETNTKCISEKERIEKQRKGEWIMEHYKLNNDQSESTPTPSRQFIGPFA